MTRRIDLVGLDEVPPGTMRMAWADGTDPVIVVNLDGDVRAFQGICSHEYFELDKGFLTRDSLTCALHLSRFDLASGDALDPPAELPLVRYPVAVEAGRVTIEVPDGPLAVNEYGAGGRAGPPAVRAPASAWRPHSPRRRPG